MINKIIVKNINSIGTYEIDFKKGNYKFLEENTINDLVNPIAIYGYNGSGKSSFFKAIAQFISFLVSIPDSLAPFLVNQFEFENYFTGNKDISKVTGSIEIYFTLNNYNYEYYFSTTNEKEVYIGLEKLIKDNKIIFSRSKDEYIFENKTNIISPGLIPILRRLASTEINNDDIQRVYSYLSSFTFVDLPNINTGRFAVSKILNNIPYIELLTGHSKEVKEILKEYKQFPVYEVLKDENKNSFSYPQSKYFVEIESKDFKGKLPFELVSNGMRNTSVLLSILLSLPKNGALFVDELEQALHPTALKSFIEIAKKKKLQLVFSTHNTSILQELRPDQVYFTKWDKGFTSIDRLSKIYPNIREVNNIEKMYLSSTFDRE